MFSHNKEKPGLRSAAFFFKKKKKETSVSSLLIHPFNTSQQSQIKIQPDYTADLSSSQLCVCGELYQLVGLFWTPFFFTNSINREAAELV